MHSIRAKTETVKAEGNAQDWSRGKVEHFSKHVQACNRIQSTRRSAHATE